MLDPARQARVSSKAAGRPWAVTPGRAQEGATFDPLAPLPPRAPPLRPPAPFSPLPALSPAPSNAFPLSSPRTCALWLTLTNTGPASVS